MGKGMDIHHVGVTAAFGTLERVRSLTWPEVKAIWCDNEENLEHWKKYWESQGYKSWEDWRRKFFWRFNTANADWALYKFVQPTASIPCLKPGPFRGWRRLSGDDKVYRNFAELAGNKKVANHPPLQQFKDFLRKLKQTTIVGLYDEPNNITVIEGMHRCAAYTLSILEDQELPETEFYIALGLGGERLLSKIFYRFGYL